MIYIIPNKANNQVILLLNGLICCFKDIGLDSDQVRKYVCASRVMIDSK